MSVGPERFAQVDALFREARALDRAARAELLAERCGTDAELRREAEELLAAGEDEGRADVFSEPGIARVRGALEGLLPGTGTDDDGLPAEIDGYRVLRRIGRGGAGTVDLGRGPQPYFVMELIEGTTLLLHAQQAALDRRARLGLVAGLCDAVQHAHERGIVHRDLKPDNVLVDARGEVKVLDFGIARVRAGDSPFTTIHTAQGELVGTLTHMAPEQLSGERDAVGPAADVYALGVIAFQLLAGRLPHEVAGLSITEAVRLIGSADAPRLGAIDRTLRGDLETIVAKALEQDPARRYVSAAALGADLRRFLAHEPIAARAPSLAYRTRKLARRHPGPIGGLSAAFLAISIGIVLAVRSGVEARARAHEAERASYRTALAAASSALAAGTRDAVAAHLDSAPAHLRGWEWGVLASRSAPTWRTLDAPLGVARVATSARRPLAAMGFYDEARKESTLRTYSLETFALGEFTMPHWIVALAFARDDTRLVSVCVGPGRSEVRALDLADGRLLREQVVEGEDVTLAQEGGRYATSGPGARGGVRVFDALDGRQLLATDLSLREIGLGWSGRLLYGSDSEAGESVILDVDTGAELQRQPWSRLFMADGARRLITENSAGVHEVYDLTPGLALVDRFRAARWDHGAFSADADRFAWLDRSKTLRVFELSTSRLFPPLGEQPEGFGPSLRFTPDGEHVLTCGVAGTDARLWSLEASAGDALRGHRTYVYSTLLLGEPFGAGRLAVSGGWDG